MKKILLILCVGLFALVACQPQPAPADEAPTPTLEPQATATLVMPTLTTVPTAIPPTATFLPESLAGSAEEFMGIWKLRWSDIAILFMDIKLNGQYRLTFQDGTEVDHGTFSFDGGRLTWYSAAGACTDVKAPTAEYDVYVTKQGERTMQIRFSLVGDDKCSDRKETNNQKWDTANP